MIQKPHIFKAKGWWRVSLTPKPYWKHAPKWRKAHDFVFPLNHPRLKQ